jgi:hypothetical protein
MNVNKPKMPTAEDLVSLEGDSLERHGFDVDQMQPHEAHDRPSVARQLLKGAASILNIAGQSGSKHTRRLPAYEGVEADARALESDGEWLFERES